jgi:pimeloyl-ACP methyl ester carboxylesterase
MFRRERRKKLIGVGFGLGAILLTLKYALRRPTKAPVPDTISPAIFATKVHRTTQGHIVYHESGSGQPLIFVHGLCIGASSYEWSKVYPEFASDFRVLAPDWIGFGESERPKARLHASDYVRALSEFIRGTCWEEPPILIGSGLGAGLCVHVASQHPELVSRLILATPAGRADFGRTRLSRTAKWIARTPLLNRFVYRNYQSTKSAVRAWLTRAVAADSAAATDEMADVFATCAQQYGADHALLNLHAGRLNFDLEARFKTLAQPVTLLWGDQSVFPPIELAYRLQPAINNCNLVILKNVGAFPALEDAPQVIRTLRHELETDLRIYKAG